MPACGMYGSRHGMEVSQPAIPAYDQPALEIRHHVLEITCKANFKPLCYKMCPKTTFLFLIQLRIIADSRPNAEYSASSSLLHNKATQQCINKDHSIEPSLHTIMCCVAVDFEYYDQ